MPSRPDPVDYLIVGHVAQDLTPDGPRLGGTAAYSALTARALGLRVGVLTSAPTTFPLANVLADAGVQVVTVPADHPTTFTNTYDDQGTRIQTLSSQAAPLGPADVPDAWRHPAIAHLAPLAGEVHPELASCFPSALLGVTPQGWLRQWDETGRVSPQVWRDPDPIVSMAAAVVLSIEDVDHDERQLEDLAARAALLVVTRAEKGCSLHWHGEWRQVPAPQVPVVDPTGAGDIFAAAYYYRLHLTRGDPVEAAHFATHFASGSVTRAGLDGIPTEQEVREFTRTAS